MCDSVWLNDVSGQVLTARWLLHRLGEDFGIVSTFNPKPVKGDWNGVFIAWKLMRSQREGSGMQPAGASLQIQPVSFRIKLYPKLVHR